MHTVVSADTPSVIGTTPNGKQQLLAPWDVESPGGTATKSGYINGVKRCLSAEERVWQSEEEGER